MARSGARSDEGPWTAVRGHRVPYGSFSVSLCLSLSRCVHACMRATRSPLQWGGQTLRGWFVPTIRPPTNPVALCLVHGGTSLSLSLSLSVCLSFTRLVVIASPPPPNPCRRSRPSCMAAALRVLLAGGLCVSAVRLLGPREQRRRRTRLLLRREGAARE